MNSIEYLLKNCTSDFVNYLDRDMVLALLRCNNRNLASTVINTIPSQKHTDNRRKCRTCGEEFNPGMLCDKVVTSMFGTPIHPVRDKTRYNLYYKWTGSNCVVCEANYQVYK